MRHGVTGALLAAMLMACGGGTNADPSEPALETGEVSSALCSPYSYVFTYYADCTRTQVVGSEYLNCWGQRSLQGTKTRYYDAEIDDLCPAPCGTYPYSGTCN